MSDRLPRPWLFPLAVFAVTWLLIVAAWHIADVLYGHHFPWTWHIQFMDTGFYRGIAEHGYTGDSARGAFFPLYPGLIHLASYLTGGDYLAAGLVTSIACGAAAALAVWALADRVAGRRVADLAVLLFCVFPGAMTFALLYSEPLAVALSATTLLFLVERRWLLTGLTGALATAERPQLSLLIAISAVAALQAIRARRDWRALLAPALTPLGILGFFAYLWHHYHNYAYWFYIENKDWHQHFDGGAQTFRVLLWLAPKDAHHPWFVVMLTGMFLAAVTGNILAVAARLPLPLILFSALTTLLVITSSDGDTRPRFVWTAFPIFIAAAAKLPRVIYWPVLIISATGFVTFVGAWRHVFGPNTVP